MPITLDAPQRALAFLISQTAFIEPEVYRTKYRQIQYQDLIPVDVTAPDWTPSVLYFSSDWVGGANWFSGRAMDVPHAEVLREKFQTGVAMAAIGYRYDTEELSIAAQLGMNLGTEKADAARLAAEMFIDRVAILGDTTKNYFGLVNNPTVAVGSAPNGAGGSPAWASKTPDEILNDGNNSLSGIFTGTLGVEMADTLLLPYTQMLAINTRRIDAVNQTTILEWIMRNNIYTLTTKQPLTIRGVWGLETAGAGGTSRLVAYRRDKGVVKLHMPMPFRFLPVYQVGPMLFEVPGILRMGGVDIRRPASFRYLDGI